MPETTDTPGGLAILAVFLLIMAPIYIVFRYFVGLVRMAYGFSAPEDGPPLRVCPKCHNTVLEDDFEHCPYCGHELPPVEQVRPVADDQKRPV